MTNQEFKESVDATIQKLIAKGYNMKYSLNKREVELELEMEEQTMYAMSGTFTDNGAELTQDELDQIQDDYAAELEQEHYERCLSTAEAYYEGDR